LKRKISELPPLSSEVFAEKILQKQTDTRLERERATFEKNCAPCNKTYYSENGYVNHLGSNKHRQNVATAQMNAIRAGGSARTITARARDQDEKDETASVVSSTFSLGEPVGEEPSSSKEGAALVEKVESLNISNESTPTQSVAASVHDDKDEKDEAALPLEACLFCPYVSPSLTLNVSHMSKAHGLFIPEATYLVDLPGLIKYLGQKLVFGNMCLYCNKQKAGLEGVRSHMQGKGHTMLGFESEEQQIELGQFYDFRSTYSDAGEESSSSDEAEEKATEGEGADEEWEDEEGNGEGWETDSDTSIDSTNLGSIPIDRVPRSSRRTEPAGHHMQDGWHSHAHAIYHDDYELHLPSGRSVGHRSLARYYRQNLRDHPIAPVRRAVEYRRAADMEDEDDEEGGVEVDENRERALNRRERREEARAVARRGEMGMTGATIAQKRDVQKFTKLAQAEEQRGRRRFEHVVNKKGNSQKHFRDPLLQ
jgi:pre-60S factor REI1